ncbi:MAG: hypothetical protein ACRD37_12850, partial [Candidatus Acidiferrales bacterium]
EWDIYNEHEKGGIAKPSLFLIGQGRTVLFRSFDTISSRVSASEIVRVIQSVEGPRPARRRLYFPHPADIFRIMRNVLRFGIRSPRS